MSIRTMVLFACLLRALPAFAASDAAQETGGWTVKPSSRPMIGRGCTATRHSAQHTIEIFAQPSDERKIDIYISATSDRLKSIEANRFSITVQLDSDAPSKFYGTAVPWYGRHTFGIASLHTEPGLAVAGLDMIGRMQGAKTMTVTIDLSSAHLDIAGLVDALPKLEACVKDEAGVKEAANAAHTKSCDALIDKIAKHISGVAEGGFIKHPDAGIAINCRGWEESFSISLRGEAGYSPAFRKLADLLAADLIGASEVSLGDAVSQCLARVRRYQIKNKGRRSSWTPSGASVSIEGKFATRLVEYECEYYDVSPNDVTFSITRR